MIASLQEPRLHPNLKAIEMIQSEINAVEASDGALLIPAFALERTQELLHIIMHLKKTKKIKTETPVFLDSPMALQATEIYLNYVDMLNEHIQNDERTGGAFEFPGLHVTRKREDSEGIWDLPGAKIIIAGGGMMTGGRIVSHAAHYLSHPQNHLLIVGYQGEETLGRELMEGSKKVTINDVGVPVNASVKTTRAMSSHADQRQLIEWLGAIKDVKKVILTHGEDGPRTVLAEKITQELAIKEVAMPHLHDEITL